MKNSSHIFGLRYLIVISLSTFQIASAAPLEFISRCNLTTFENQKPIEPLTIDVNSVTNFGFFSRNLQNETLTSQQKLIWIKLYNIDFSKILKEIVEKNLAEKTTFIQTHNNGVETSVVSETFEKYLTKDIHFSYFTPIQSVSREIREILRKTDDVALTQISIEEFVDFFKNLLYSNYNVSFIVKFAQDQLLDVYNGFYTKFYQKLSIADDKTRLEVFNILKMEGVLSKNAKFKTAEDLRRQTNLARERAQQETNSARSNATEALKRTADELNNVAKSDLPTFAASNGYLKVELNPNFLPVINPGIKVAFNFTAISHPLADIYEQLPLSEPIEMTVIGTVTETTQQDGNVYGYTIKLTNGKMGYFGLANGLYHGTIYAKEN